MYFISNDTMSFVSKSNKQKTCVQKYLLTNTCLSFVNRLVIFCSHVSHLLDFDTADMISFDTKYLLLRNYHTK